MKTFPSCTILLMITMASATSAIAKNSQPTASAAVTYHLRVIDNNKQVNDLLLSVETRLGSVDLNKFDENSVTKALVLPVEMRVRIPIHPQRESSTDLIRIGAMRFILGNVGITTQVASYLYKHSGLMGITAQGIEIANFSFNRAFTIVEENEIEILIKGTMAFGSTWARSTNTTIVKAADEQGFENNDGLSPAASAFGSVGVRVRKQFLIDIYGSASYESGGYRNESIDLDGRVAYQNLSHGISLEYLPKDFLKISTKIEQSTLGTYLTADRLFDPMLAKDEKDVLSTYLTLEFRY